MPLKRSLLATTLTISSLLEGQFSAPERSGRAASRCSSDTWRPLHDDPRGRVPWRFDDDARPGSRPLYIAAVVMVGAWAVVLAVLLVGLVQRLF
jgi:hypothetical protein